MEGNLFFLINTIVILGGAGIFFAVRIAKRREIENLIHLRLLSVQLPPRTIEAEKEKRDPVEDVNRFAQLLSGLAGPKSLFVFEVAVHNVGSDIVFYVAIPRSAVELLTRQIHGLWADAQVDLVEDYTVFNAQGRVRAGYLKQRQETQVPLRTYEDVKLDTFQTVLSNFSKLQHIGEGLSLQIVMRSAPKEEKAHILGNISRLKKGGRMDIRGRVSDPPKTDPKKPAAEKTTIDEEAIKLLEAKISKPLFYADVRLLASAGSEPRAQELLEGLAAAFAQFTSPRHNELKLVVMKNHRRLAFDFSFRNFRRDQRMLLNAGEVASFYHFPVSSAGVSSKVAQVKTRQVQPPLNLPPTGTPIGESVYRGETRPVNIGDEDRRRHVYLIGQTGTGKTSLLQNMIRDDIEKGKGIAVIDPHGDLIDDTLGIIPPNRVNDVIVFNPGDIERPVGLNMLEFDFTKPEQKTFIVNEMQSIFGKLFTQETMGPMFEQYMRNALQLLMEDAADPGTLMEVPRLFTDEEYRKRKLAIARNPAVIDFWEKEATKVGGEASLKNMTPYITSKFNNFIANDYVRPIIGQQRSAFNFRAVMDENKILLVNLSKGRIGDINAGLLGMVIVGKLLMAALSRVDIEQGARKDFNLYIDEFQNFTTDSIATILSEARKYRLNLVIAHQFIAQLEDEIRDAVFGNVGSVISFRVGAEDAEFLTKQFEPVFNKNDLINIDNFNAYVRLLIQGQTTAPFNIKTIPPKKGDPPLAFRIRELSRLTYGADQKAIEENILKRLRA